MSGVTEVKADGDLYAREVRLRSSAIGKKATHYIATLARGDQTDKCRASSQGRLEGLFIAMPLSRNDHDARRGDHGRCTGRPVDQVPTPADVAHQIEQGRGHWRIAHNKNMRSLHDRFDVDLQRTVALAGNWNSQYSLGHVHPGEVCFLPEPDQRRRAFCEHSLRFTDEHRLSTCSTDPSDQLTLGGHDCTRAMLTRRRSLAPHNGRQDKGLTGTRERCRAFHDVQPVNRSSGHVIQPSPVAYPRHLCRSAMPHRRG